MFARTRIAGIIVAAVAVFATPGCENPNGPQPKDAQQRRGRPSLTDDKYVLGENELTPAKIQAGTYIAAARLHETQGHLLQAVQQYQFALNEDPRNAEILGHMGVLYDRIGNSAAAVDAYQRALQIAPDDAQLHNNLAFSYIIRKQWKQAEGELNRALAISPEFARARVNLAMTLAQLDRFGESLAEFKKVLPPEDAHYNLGLMYQSKRKLVEAAEQYKLALEANPKLVAAENQLKRMPSVTLSEADRRLAADRKPEAIAQASEVEDESEIESSPPEGLSPAADVVPISKATSRPAVANEPAAAMKPVVPAEEHTFLDDCAWDHTYLESLLPRQMTIVSPPPATADEKALKLTTVTTRPADNAAPVRPQASIAAPAVPSRQNIDTVRVKSDLGDLALPAPIEGGAVPTALGAAWASRLDSVLPVWQRSPELIADLATSSSSSWMASVFGDRWLDRVESPAPQLMQNPLRTEGFIVPQPSTRPQGD